MTELFWFPGVQTIPRKPILWAFFDTVTNCSKKIEFFNFGVLTKNIWSAILKFVVEKTTM